MFIHNWLKLLPTVPVWPLNLAVRSMAGRRVVTGEWRHIGACKTSREFTRCHIINELAKVDVIREIRLGPVMHIEVRAFQVVTSYGIAKSCRVIVGATT